MTWVVKPLFGAASTPAFGGQPATPTFGASSTGFGSTQPAFGAGFGAASTPAFGAASSPGAFGAATPAFGSSTPAFGAGEAPARLQSPTVIQIEVTSLLQTSCEGRSIQKMCCCAGGFGGAFGTPQGAVGTRAVQHQKTQDVDSSTSGGQKQTVFFNSISAMPQYQNKCPEELRWEDYQVVLIAPNLGTVSSFYGHCICYWQAMMRHLLYRAGGCQGKHWCCPSSPARTVWAASRAFHLWKGTAGELAIWPDHLWKRQSGSLWQHGISLTFRGNLISGAVLRWHPSFSAPGSDLARQGPASYTWGLCLYVHDASRQDTMVYVVLQDLGQHRFLGPQAVHPLERLLPLDLVNQGRQHSEPLALHLDLGRQPGASDPQPAPSLVDRLRLSLGEAVLRPAAHLSLDSSSLHRRLAAQQHNLAQALLPSAVLHRRSTLPRQHPLLPQALHHPSSVTPLEALGRRLHQVPLASGRLQLNHLGTPCLEPLRRKRLGSGLP